MSVAVAICVTAVVAIALLSKAVPPSYAFAADATQDYTGLVNHSTFHYEFTRVLAAAAGFSAKEAEEIAVACEATDTNTFTGYNITGGAITLNFTNTHRIESANRFFYHFGRRALDYPLVTKPDGTAYTGTLQNTCGYFSGVPQPSGEVTAPCDAPEKGELDQLREWAINGTALTPGRGPMVESSSTIPHDDNLNVTGQNIYALGIYLHALGDSYSHEKCMIDAQFRYHKLRPYPCRAKWHLKSEFGPYLGDQAQRGAGVPFTLTAAEAVWQEVLKYRKATGAVDPPRWDHAQFTEFARKFVALPSARLRVDFAVSKFNELTDETFVPGGSAKKAPTRKKKQG